MPPAIVLTPQQRAQIEEERIVHAYRAMFGTDESQRSEIQRLVWNDLQKAGYAKQPIFVPDKMGALCPLRAAFTDGRRSLLLYIESNVMFEPDAPKQEPQRRRRNHG